VAGTTSADHEPLQVVSHGRWAVASPTQLRSLRAQLRHHAGLWGLPDDCVDRIVMIVNELASNAFDHARTGCAVTVRHTRALVRVLVADGSPLPPRRAPHNVKAVRGRGLQMVSALANRWGWTARNGGKTVWAAVNCDQA
jgi:two-component sensor histidine kinase